MEKNILTKLYHYTQNNFLIVYNVRRYISVAEYEVYNNQISNNLNTRTNDKRNTKTAIEYRCC